MKLVLIVLVFIICCNCQTTLKALATIDAIDGIKDALIPVVEPYLLQTPIPDTSGSEDGVSYDISNIKITTFDFGDADLTLEPSSGLSILLSSATCQLTMDWSYHTVIVSGHGSAIDDLTMTINVELTLVEDQGHLSAQVSDVSVDVTDITITLHGGNSWFYKIMVDIFHSKIQSIIQNVIQQQLSQSVNTMITNYALAAPTTYDFGNGLIFDYSLTQNPIVYDNFTETDHIGAWSLNSVNTCTFSAQPIPEVLGWYRTLTFLLSETLFDCLGYVLYMNGLQTQVTPSDIPSNSPVQLNTGNDNMKKLLPNLYEYYPNSPMYLEITVIDPPVTNIETTNFTLALKLNINVTVMDNQSVIVPAFDMLVDTWITSGAGIDINDENITIITGQVTGETHNVSVLSSDIGNVNVNSLYDLVSFFIRFGVLPTLDNMGDKGFPIPNMPGLTFIFPEIFLEDGFLRASTDFLFNPSEIISPRHDKASNHILIN